MRYGNRKGGQRGAQKNTGIVLSTSIFASVPTSCGSKKEVAKAGPMKTGIKRASSRPGNDRWWWDRKAPLGPQLAGLMADQRAVEGSKLRSSDQLWVNRSHATLHLVIPAEPEAKAAADPGIDGRDCW